MAEFDRESPPDLKDLEFLMDLGLIPSLKDGYNLPKWVIKEMNNETFEIIRSLGKSHESNMRLVYNRGITDTRH